MLEHAEYVRLHPGTCPANPYAPDHLTAEAYGLHRRGDKMKNDYVPRNFWKPETLLKDIDPNADLRTPATIAGDAEVAAAWAALPEETKQWFAEELERARQALVTIPTSVEPVPSPQVWSPTVPTNESLRVPTNE